MQPNSFYCEDNLETMSRMTDGYVDHVITSPPYNLGKDVNTFKSKYATYSDNLTQDEFFEWQKKVITELLRVTKKHIFYNIQVVSGNKQAVFRLFGYFAVQIKEVIIWDKRHGEPAMRTGVMNSVWEFVIVFSHNEPHLRQFKECEWRGTVDNIFRIKKNYNETDVEHSALMPLYLPRYLLTYFTKEGELIYDPFFGLGTTAIACIREKRRYIGSEISQEYVKEAEKRLRPYITQTTMF